MSDENLEKIKIFLLNFKDYEDLKTRYIDVYHPNNEKLLEELFDSAKSSSDVWNLTKYLFSNESLRIDKLQRKMENYTIKDIVNLINANDLNNYKRIVISLDNIDYNNLEDLEKLNIPILIQVKGDKGLCTLDEFKNMRKIFSDFRKSCETYTLSPVEKVTLAYDYVKFYYYNREENQNKTESRQLAKLLNTGNIVCEGYAKMFCQLLKELELDSYLVYIDEHVRVIVNVKDEKYNIKDVYAFDPTWDSDLEMAYVAQEDGVECYKIKSDIKETDTIIEKMPSTIRYNFYMIPLLEYSKYFPNDKFEEILKYGTTDTIDLEGVFAEAIHYNDNKPRNNETINLLMQVLPKTKKIEGYSNEQIEHFIENAINIMNQDRFGKFDKYNLVSNVSRS